MPGSSSSLPDFPPTDGAALPAYLASFTNFETQRPLPTSRREIGPERCRLLLERSGQMPRDARVIQVAGSKGKPFWVPIMTESSRLTSLRAPPPTSNRAGLWRFDSQPFAFSHFFIGTGWSGNATTDFTSSAETGETAAANPKKATTSKSLRKCETVIL